MHMPAVIVPAILFRILFECVFSPPFGRPIAGEHLRMRKLKLKLKVEKLLFFGVQVLNSCPECQRNTGI